MNVIVDTNIIARVFTGVDEDVEQKKIVLKLFKQFDEVIIPTHVFCELTWTLISRYKFQREQVLFALKEFLQISKIVCKEDEVEAGLAMLRKGGDFADGVNEYTGRQMSRGATVFASFDKKAVGLLTERGIPAMIPQL
ncbi:DNA-binding protein [Betaproteobacteria bacterium]|nr:DNA-binding protein [Betaproteobacteria bacterium]GHU19666.1 DNA-binding protein [Betaproteobacteria bacterium]